MLLEKRDILSVKHLLPSLVCTAEEKGWAPPTLLITEECEESQDMGSPLCLQTQNPSLEVRESPQRWGWGGNGDPG